MTSILLFTLIACIGMLVQSFAGFAGSLVAIPLFALFLSPKEAIPAYNLVMLVIDAWLVYEARKYLEWGQVRKLMLGGLIGTPIGAYGLKYLPSQTLCVVISIITLLFAVFFMLKLRIRLSEGAGTQFSVGLMSGLLGGSISASGPPVVIYGLAREWDKNKFRTTLLTYFTALAVAAVPFHWQLGLFSTKSLATFGFAVIPCLLAGAFGVAFKNRVSEAVFRQSVLVVIVMVSLIGLSKPFLK